MIYIITLTRDRLQYTQDCLTQLHRMAGEPFYHLVIDNGSKDGTAEWLRNKYQHQHPNIQVVWLPENVGISKAMNLGRDILRHHELKAHDLVIKVDSDCYVKSSGILTIVQDVYNKSETQELFLSPNVLGLRNKVYRHSIGYCAGYNVGWTHIIGGIFQPWRASLFLSWRDNEQLPKAWGQDDMLAAFGSKNGWLFGYLEDYEVEHYKGTDQQWADYPDYFKRKLVEEGDRQFPTSPGLHIC